MIAWIVYAALVGVLVAATATAVDRLARLAQWPTRWVWCTAAVVALGLAAVAPYRTSSPAPVLETTANVTSGATVIVAPEPWWAVVSRTLSDARTLVEAPFVMGAAALHHRLPLSAGAFVIAAWLVMSVVLAILGLAVHARFRSGMRRWPLADVHGTRVRVSPTTGPVVIGLARPEIVLPRWVLDRPASEQMVILAHEAEHIKSRDGLLLAGACGAVALMPWNPALWYMLSRMRLAVELDCDARVLRAGIAPKTYGTLLIDLAEQVLPLRVTATALADDLSHLHKRILAMKPHTPRFALLRGGAAAAIAVAGLLAACEAKMPTAADIQQMDVASAEKSARDLRVAQLVDSTTRYIVDSVYVTAARARALSAESIATVGIAKQPDGRATVLITTLRGTGDSVILNDGPPARMVASGGGRVGRGRVGGGNLDSALTAQGQRQGLSSTPIFIIDGARADQATFRRLRPDDIESIEVLKGKAAAAQYGADAANGVITVKTKVQRD